MKRGRPRKGSVRATGRLRATTRDAVTLDQFLEEQRIRVMNTLRRPIPEEGQQFEHEHGIHPRARKNEGLTRAQIYQTCQQETRGRV